MRLKNYCICFYFLLSVVCNAQWEPDVRLTNDTAESRTSFDGWCVAANADIVHVVWHDFRNGDSEVYYKQSTDSGLTWGKDIRLTYYLNHSRIPTVAVSGPVVHIVWEDARDYDMDVPPDEPIGIKPISGEFPKQFRLYRNYPNPFNPSTTIKFDIPMKSFVKLVVYDILGREVSNLINEALQPGQYKVVWDGSAFLSGVYYCRFVADNRSISGIMILIK